MTSRQRVQAALSFSGPDRLPRDVWGVRSVAVLRPNDWRAVVSRFPMDFDRAPTVLGQSSKSTGGGYETGTRVDDWGCVWSTLQNGVSGEVIRPAVAEWSDLASFDAPWEMVEKPASETVNSFCRSSEAFVLGEVGPGPFERMQYLRGTENLFLDLGEDSPELGKLTEMVHEFYLKHFQLWSQTEVDGITIGDDWGSQTALLISPTMWRRLFKPLYARYIEIVHRAGKKMFFHSDGVVRDIIPDLIEIGADALNHQLFCMDIEEIGRSFRGKVTFWGEVDRQYILPFGTVEEVRQGVRRLKQALYTNSGGLIAQLSWGIDDPIENIVAAFEEWDL